MVIDAVGLTIFTEAEPLVALAGELTALFDLFHGYAASQPTEDSPPS
ncbi:MAG: hypothetical protein SGI77_23665 [Pirellulaceae bacterium]|nr:hypothetical protein [Pirellulaceae bacterium]